jgi:4-amino-4-deoxy-L-arabinose transferase-like glycosyltransferase
MNLQRLGSQARRSKLFGWLEHQAKAHPVLFVFTAALIVRVVVALVLSATVGMGPFPDNKIFGELASDVASGRYQHWGGTFQNFFERLAGYALPLGVLYRLFGEHLLFGQLLAALFGAVAAAAICALVLMVANRRTALTAGFIMVLFPSQVLWSSVPYRDSEVWAVSALAALLVAVGARARGRALAAVGAGIAALVFLLGHLRLQTTVAVCGALVIAALCSERELRALRVAGALAIAVIVPWYLGIGPGGSDLVRPQGEVRAALACGAKSAVVKCDSGDESGSGSKSGSGGEPELSALSDSAVVHDLRHLPRGLSVMLLEPLPWTSVDGLQPRLAQLETLLLWFPLVVIGAFGVPLAYRHRLELSFLFLTAGALLIAEALGEGNVGTAFRHRAELVPALAVLAALGAPRAVARWRSRRPGHQTTRPVGGTRQPVAAPDDEPLRDG